MKFLDFDSLLDLLQQAPHKVLSTKVSKKAITYSVQIGEKDKIDFRVGRKLASTK